MFRRVGVLLVCGVLAGCADAKPSAEDTGTFEAPRDLTATLVDGLHVDLAWRHTATAPGGGFIEFKMGPHEDHFTMLEAVWPGTEAFRHPDVAPDTTFIYRVRSFFGRPSDVVVIDTGKKTDADNAPEEVEGPLDGSDPMKPRGPTKTRTSFAPVTAPSHLTAASSSATSVELRWRDRATDEDGYVVEMKTEADTDYKICALLPPDSGSFRKTALPEQARVSFRVRAFFYGQSSNLASVTTPPSAAQKSLRELIEGPGAGRP